jgi:myo-inositol-1(or 4)-monophosphatase
VAAPDELLDVARALAEAAGELLRARFGEPRAGVRAKTTPTDLVSDADHAAEKLIRRELAARRPDDAILGEEGGSRAGGSGLRWVVDPLDGTVNFLFGIPHWAVSVACEDDEGALAGVIHDPLRGETFAAARRGQPTLGTSPIAGSTATELPTALVATGYAYDAEVRARQAEVSARVITRARDLRRGGSAALDLAWTACGRFDAFYERGLQPWDRAAGALLCARAGLELRELAARDGLPAGLLVAPAGLVDELSSLVGGA